MPTTIAPLFFGQIAKERLIVPLEQDAVRSAVSALFQKKLGALPSGRSCLPSADNLHTFADASQAVHVTREGFEGIEAISSKLQGAQCLGLITAPYAAIGWAWVHDNAKQSEQAEAIGDHTGAQLAQLHAVENGFLTAGSTAGMPLKIVGLAEEILAARHASLSLNTGASIAQSVFSWASTAFFLAYYLLNIMRLGFGLVSWTQGHAWRKELLDAEDPIKAVKSKLQNQIYQLELSQEEYKELALKAGARWMQRVEKEAKAAGISLNFKDRREAFERYVELHPEVITSMVGRPLFQVTAEGLLIFLGKHLAIQNACAKFEAECARKLGSKTVAALKANDSANIKEALSSKGWAPLAFKITMAVVGIFSIITATVFSGGLALGVILALTGIGALISIYLEDWSALKEHLEKGEFRKRDRFFVYFTVILSVAAVAGLITLSILSGGVTAYLVALILTTAWLVINLRAMKTMWKYDIRPWESQKQPTIETVQKMLKTQPGEEAVNAVIKRMSEEDRAFIQASNKKNILEALQDLQVAYEKKRQELFEELQKTS